MLVFVTGACGYKGSVLVPKLLGGGHDVVAFDIMWFGNFLEPHPNLTVVQGDVRNAEDIDLTASTRSSISPAWPTIPAAISTPSSPGKSAAWPPCSLPTARSAPASSASSTPRRAASMA